MRFAGRNTGSTEDQHTAHHYRVDLEWTEQIERSERDTLRSVQS